MAPYVSLTAQRRLNIALPSIEHQQAIGGLLDLLDKKIELNSRMAETLQAIIHGLFKSWFVDFEPVRARQKAGPSAFLTRVRHCFRIALEKTDFRLGGE